MLTYIDISAIYGIIFYSTCISWFFFEMWVLFREDKKVSGKKIDKASRILAMVIIWLGILLGFIIMFITPHFDIKNYYLLFFIVGIFLAWSGLVFRFWSIQTLGKYFHISVFINSDHKLITSGPYRYLRNPSYTGEVITVLGLGLVMGNWLSVIAMLFYVLIVYSIRIPLEQKTLVEYFGQEYTDYIKKTWALIPFVW